MTSVVLNSATKTYISLIRMRGAPSFTRTYILHGWDNLRWGWFALDRDCSNPSFNRNSLKSYDRRQYKWHFDENLPGNPESFPQIHYRKEFTLRVTNSEKNLFLRRKKKIHNFFLIGKAKNFRDCYKRVYQCLAVG